MKRVYVVSVFVMLLAMLFLPLAAGGIKETDELPAMGDSLLSQSEEKTERFRVLRKATGEIEEMSAEDYLFSVLAAEMPALYEVEALKAQTVAAYTYALRKAEVGGDSYDITDDSATDQAFITREAAREKWGDKADIYEEKLRSAVKSVLGQRLTFEGKTILAAYHAISSGKTENARELWSGDYSYLTATDSSWDKLSPDYLSTVTLTADELKEKLSSLVALEGEAASWLKDAVKSESGSIVSLSVGGKSLTGSEIRGALSLRSANFDFAFSEGNFTFTVRGYGHGIGMSQNGANYMAEQGKSYEEILLHYYKGCKIE